MYIYTAPYGCGIESTSNEGRGACVEKLDKAKGGCGMHGFNYVVNPLIMGAMMPQFFRPSTKKIASASIFVSVVLLRKATYTLLDLHQGIT